MKSKPPLQIRNNTPEKRKLHAIAKEQETECWTKAERDFWWARNRSKAHA